MYSIRMNVEGNSALMDYKDSTTELKFEVIDTEDLKLNLGRALYALESMGYAINTSAIYEAVMRIEIKPIVGKYKTWFKEEVAEDTTLQIQVMRTR